MKKGNALKSKPSPLLDTRVIISLTVKEILEENIAKKLAWEQHRS